MVNLRKENYKYSYDLFIANFYKSIIKYKKRISKEILIEFKLYYINHRTILDKSTIRRLDSEERDSLSVCSNSSFNYSKSFNSEELFENHINIKYQFWLIHLKIFKFLILFMNHPSKESHSIWPLNIKEFFKQTKIT